MGKFDGAYNPGSFFIRWRPSLTGRPGFETQEPQGSFFYCSSLVMPQVRKHSAGDQHRLRGAWPFPFSRPEP
ncbi:hypothetical protein HN51_19660 [Ectopseudomonas mendocina]|jgi:hypothetical protein|nr:hypothetical protein HN51_19660 [Pseudomonas mendocina]